MTGAEITAGYVQFNPILGDPEKNIRTLGPLIRQGSNCDLLVLPELSNSGYNFESKDQAFELSEETGRSRFVDFLATAAARHRLYIVAGMNEREDGKLYNTAVLIGPDGLVGKYRKIHLFWNEFDFFEKGNLGLDLFDIGMARIGILICFDWVFPEVWRILAMKGADIICHPSNLVLPYAHTAVPVHGLINRTFIITANRYGTERGTTFNGQSFISDPMGEKLTRSGDGEDDVQWARLDLAMARNKMITPRNHLMDDRSPGDYGALVE